MLHVYTKLYIQIIFSFDNLYTTYSLQKYDRRILQCYFSLHDYMLSKLEILEA